MNRVLVIGAGGQLGLVLTKRLQQTHGMDNVISSDIREIPQWEGPFESLDATSMEDLTRIISKHDIREIYHLAAILSAAGEQTPLRTMDVNMKTLTNVLEASRLFNVEKVFFPSSIAVFGPDVAKESTPQDAHLNPLTVYGVSKAAGENWVNYYFHKYGLDVRSIRYPGLISYQSEPGGGTTDYAVDIYHKAVEQGSYECFLNAETKLPMMYMDDAVNATVDLMQADRERITVRTSYNISSLSFTPSQLAASIARRIPTFDITYKPDFRQQIADGWPASIDDTAARQDWGWQPKYDLDAMTDTMLDNLIISQELKKAVL